jgi:hypothetical protein
MQPLGGDNWLIRTAKSPKKSPEPRFAATEPKKSKNSQEFPQNFLIRTLNHALGEVIAEHAVRIDLPATRAEVANAIADSATKSVLTARQTVP